MAQNYTRQSSFADGDTITAALFNNEFNQVVNAFAYSASSDSSTGHKHDGTSGQGGNIPQIGDIDFLNKIVVDNTNNRWGFYVQVSGGTVEQLRIQDGAIVPVTNNDIDLGTSSLEFKDLFLDGTAHIDTLDVDVNATVAGTLGVTGASTLTGNVTATNDLSVGGNLTVTGNATIAGNLTFGDAATDTVAFSADVASNLLPSVDNTYDLGASGSEWKDLYIDGTANIDSLVADTADINGGTIDSAVIGGTTPAAITGTAITATGIMTATGTSVFASLDISGDIDVDGTTNLDVVDIDGAVNMATTALVTGVLTTTAATVFNGGFASNADSTLGTDKKVQFRDSAIYINSSADGQLDIVADTEIQIAATTVDVNGNLDVSGTTVSAGKITADAGIDIDNINIDGTTIALSSGDLTLDVAGDIVLDAGGTEIKLSKAGTEFGKFATDIGTPSQFAISSSVLDGDIRFQGNDGGSTITALTLDMSDAGTASFNHDIKVGSGGIVMSDTFNNQANNANVIYRSGSTTVVGNNATALVVADAGSVTFSGDIDVDGTANLDVVDIDGAVDFASTTAHAGNATFADNAKAIFGADSDLQIYHNGSHNFITALVGNINIETSGDDKDIFLASDDGSGGSVNYVQVDGSTGSVNLRHYGDVKLATTATGIDITGTAVIETGSGNTYPTASTSADNLVISDKTASTPVGITIFSDNASQGNIFFGDENDADSGRIVYDHNGNANTMSFYTNGAERLTVDSTGIDVTGTVVSDGLTVENTGSASTLTLTKTDGSAFTASAGNYSILGTDDSTNLYFKTNGSFRQLISSNGDISFYSSDGLSQALVWDASAESLGIGAIPNQILTLDKASGDVFVRFDKSGAIKGLIGVADSAGAGSGDSAQGDMIVRGQTRLLLDTTGSTAVTIDNSQNVGIGTDSPNALCDIVGSPVATGDARYELIISENNTAATGRGGGLAFARQGVIYGGIKNTASGFSDNDTDMYFQTRLAGTVANKMVIKSSGDVGIGTSSPSTALHVRDSGNPTLTIDGSDGAYTSFLILKAAGGGASLIRAEGGSNALVLQTNGDNERLRIDDSGNVGIGNSVMSSMFSSSQNLVVGTGSGNNGITVYSQSNAVGDIAFADATSDPAYYSGLIRYDHSLDAMRLFTSSEEAMRITSAGSLLVNYTASLSSIVGVRSTASATPCIATFNTAGAGSYQAKFYNNNTTALIGSITNNGNTGTSFNTTSDYRLKEDVQDMVGATNRVMALKPCNFAWKSTGERVDGFLAHEAQEIVPEAVTGEKDAVDADGNPEYQGIDQSKLVPLLVATIQELEARIAALES